MSVGAASGPGAARPAAAGFCVIDGAYRDRAIADEVSRDASPTPGPPSSSASSRTRRAAARRRGVADRVGEVLLRTRPRPRVRRDRRGAFPQAFERLVRSWIDHVDPDHDPSEVTARRISNWVYAWCRFDSVPGFGGFTEELEDELAASLEAQAAHVRANLTPHATTARSSSIRS